jgi:hypothetical protein
MRMVIEAQLEDNAGGSVPIRLVEFERVDSELKQLGLSLAEGKSLVYEAQHGTRSLIRLPLNQCAGSQHLQLDYHH